MSSGEVAFKKGNFYDGMVDSQHGSFKSDITRTMCHGVDMCLIIEHLRQFKFGRWRKLVKFLNVEEKN